MAATLDEAKAYATRLMEPLCIMFDPKKNEYVVIRAYAKAHWSQHYRPILDCVPQMVFTEAD